MAGEANLVPKSPLRAWAQRFWRWANSPSGRGVLKCSIAYTIATLGALPQPLISFLGKPGGKHVVATITVYFHPARSTGSMIEAVLIATAAVMYAELVSVLSMATSVFVGAVWGCVTLAHITIIVVFIGGGFGLIGWVKQRMGNPLVDVASTLASLALITVLTKETAVVEHVFSTDKIIQVLKMLMMGIISTTAVNLLLWRVSARCLVRSSMAKASESLGHMLSATTEAFIEGSEDDFDLAEFSAAASAYSSLRPQMKKNLREAKFEHLLVGDEEVYATEFALVRSIETLAQGIGGLRSACCALLAVLRVTSEKRIESTDRIGLGISTPIIISVIASPEASAMPTPSEETQELNFSIPQVSEPETCTTSQFFRRYIDSLNRPMRTLGTLMWEILCSPPSLVGNSGMSISSSRADLANAIVSFNQAKAASLQDLYDHPVLRDTALPQSQADLEQVAATCGHFAFSFQSVAEDILEHLNVLEDLHNSGNRGQKSWSWASPFSRRSVRLVSSETGLEKSPGISDWGWSIPESLAESRDTYNWNAAPQPNKIAARLSQTTLRLLRRLARDDILFGVKVGLGASLWASLSFFKQTKETYRQYSGEWGLLSFMIVCSMTVGASNTTGGSRFIGTLLGAAFSFINWKVSGGNAVALLFLGWAVSYWNFYLIISGGRPTIGRMTQLAYNVSTLYAYSIKHTNNGNPDELNAQRTEPIIEQIIQHRIVSVSFGILWGLIICRIIWPISARKKFQQGLSMMCLRMGMIWQRGPLAILIRQDYSRSFLLSGEHAALQNQANVLDRLRELAKHEFDLRGPFPSATSARVMRSVRHILDAFYSMSLISQRSYRLTPGERALLAVTEKERKLLCDRICHVFHVIASSMMLEYPVMNAVPNIASLQANLLSKIFHFRNTRPIQASDRRNLHPADGTRGGRGALPVTENDYALLYAYALVAGQVAGELELFEGELKSLYGILGKANNGL